MLSPQAPLSYRFYQGVEGLDAIRPHWVALSDGLGQRRSLPHVPFWYRCQIRCIPGCESMGFSTAWEGDRLVAVLPLVRGSRGAPGAGLLSFSTVEFPSNVENFYRDATIDPAVAPRVSLSRLARAARGSLGGDLLALSALRGDASLLTVPGVGQLVAMSTPDPSCLFVPLDASTQPDALLSRQTRSNLNNRRGRLRQFGAIRWEHAPDDLPLEDAIRTFAEVEAAGWKGEGGTRSASKFSASRLAFLGELAAGGDGLSVNVHLMYAADAPVAATYCITVGGAHLVLLTGYDERYEKTSPGQLLLHEMVRWAVARQLRELDFLSTAPHYRSWHPSERSMHHVTTSAGSLKGLLVDRANHLRKRLRKRA